MNVACSGGPLPDVSTEYRMLSADSSGFACEIIGWAVILQVRLRVTSQGGRRRGLVQSTVVSFYRGPEMVAASCVARVLARTARGDWVGLRGSTERAFRKLDKKATGMAGALGSPKGPALFRSAMGKNFPGL